MGKREDLTGQRFGQLLVIDYAGLDTSRKRALWKCRCDCGNEVVVRKDSLKRGATKSCGCLNRIIQQQFKEKATTHGLSSHRLYRIWLHMKNRCENPKEAGYELYGGRGITVCERWLDFENFAKDMLPSYEKHVALYGEKRTTIDRIDPDGDYEPSNCRWATPQVQANNTRKHKQQRIVAINLKTNEKFYGTSQTMLARRIGIPPYHISAVLKGQRKSCYGYTFRYQGGDTIASKRSG
ncbi:hypothetical protein QT238_11410 [Geobacillus stearothermophilus]|nr:hypothetical protein QT238_11410 [Geobacillus stearothermophilus]